MANARKPSISPIRANAIFQDEMAAFHLGSYPEAEQSYDSVSRCDDRVEIAVIKVLRYGLRSYHWSLLSFWWSGLVVCANRRQARFFI
jgi:hypothetical protein